MASANGLTLSSATDDQYLESLKRQVKDWGGGYSEEEFIGREFALKASEFGRAQRCWVLTPSDQLGTVDFFCSCETYRRPALFSTGTSSSSSSSSSSTSAPGPQIGVSYGIGSVFTAPRHRKKGYAKAMMKLLHVAIGLPSDTDLPHCAIDVGPEWGGGKDAVLSFLYSDVGTFYESCGPPGWHVVAPLQTSWILGELKDGWEEDLEEAATVHPITEDDFPSLVQIDSALLSSEVHTLSTSSSAPAFILPPTTANYLWSNIRTKYYAKVKQLPAPEHWGARIGDLGSGKESFITWTTDGPNSILNINRLRIAPSRPEDGASLLLEAVKAAKAAGVKRVDAWSLDEKAVESLPKELRGDSHMRTEHLSAVAVYGKGWGGVEAKDFKWGLNEHFPWL